MTAPPAGAATAEAATAVGLAEPVLDAQAAFRAALEAISRPGRPVDIPVAADAPGAMPAAMAALALTLVDGDTPVWLDSRLAAVAVPAFLRFHCGCRLADAPAAARFALIAEPAAMPPLDAFAIGRDQFPEESATLIIEAEGLTADSGPLTLRGPGIRDSVRADIAGLAPAFWPQWAANVGLFPQGVDVLFTCGTRVLGLPRTTAVERMPCT